MPKTTSHPPDAEPQALLDAVRALLEPLARLAVARGLPYAALEEALKQAVVQAACAVQPAAAAQRSVSRIATATGINRREVTRLTQRAESAPRPGPRASGRPAQAALPPGAGVDAARRRPTGRSVAGEVFAHWLGDRTYRDRKGAPRVLPRQGPAPSFETLAQAVTRDVHPRSLLDELLRLKLAVLDEQADTVALLRDGYVPRGDRARMLGFLADNAGDHLAAAVDNVLADGSRHFEQALFADGLSAASLQTLRTLVGPQWKALLAALVPTLERLVEADASIPPAQQHRVRIGLYAFDDAAADASKTDDPPPPPSPRRRARKS